MIYYADFYKYTILILCNRPKYYENISKKTIKIKLEPHYIVVTVKSFYLSCSYSKRVCFFFTGVYISKTTYIRQGEQSLDGFYRAWHQVEYYRYTCSTLSE